MILNKRIFTILILLSFVLPLISSVNFEVNLLAECTEGNTWCSYDGTESVIIKCVNGTETIIERCSDSCDYNDKAEPVCEYKDVQYTKTENNSSTGFLIIGVSIIIGLIILGFIIRKKRK